MPFFMLHHVLMLMKNKISLKKLKKRNENHSDNGAFFLNLSVFDHSLLES